MADNKQNTEKIAEQGGQVDAIVRADCYKCKYRGSIPGDAHSCCNYPGNKTGILDMFRQTSNNRAKLNIKANPYGAKNGWFMWPVNFDPVWLENCNGFTPKP